MIVKELIRLLENEDQEAKVVTVDDGIISGPSRKIVN